MKTPWVVFDTEDDSEELLAQGKSGFNKKITQISAKAWNGKTYYSEGDCEGFEKWLSRLPAVLVWFHSGGGGYDLAPLFAHRLDVLDLTFVDKRYIKAVWQNCTFCDSWNLYPLKLEEIGEAFGIKKLPRKVHSRKYVERDRDILFEAIDFASDFAESHGVELGATIGGLARRIWKERGGENWHDGFFLSSEAYVGGRAELFASSGTGRIVKTDVNSLYPWALTQPFPGPLERCENIEKKFGLVSCRVEQPQTRLAVLPVRQWDGSIVFPSGKFNGVWTMHELREAVKSGAVIEKVFEAYGTDAATYPYRDFAVSFYKDRLKSKTDFEKLWYKNLLNAFSGQLASRGEITRSVNLADHLEDDGIAYGTKMLLDVKTQLGKNVNYLHAAYVNSYARLRLLAFMRAVGPENLIYCKTDCLFFFCASRVLPFPVGDKLGGMRLEEWATDFHCYADDIYRFGNRCVAKGVPKRAANDYVRRGAAKYEAPFGIREAIAYFNADNRRPLGVWRTVRKVRRNTYRKKDLREDGRYYPRVVNQRKYYSKLEMEKACSFQDFQET